MSDDEPAYSEGMHWSVGLVVTWGALVLAPGCSSSDSTGPGTSSSQFGERYCALFKPCCTKAGLPTTQDGCRLLFGSAVAKDQAAADACLAQYEAWGQEPDWCETFAQKPRPASCEKAYPETGNTGGTKKPGETCSFSSDCAPSTKGSVDCYHDTGSGQDYCRVLVSGSAGSPCSGTRKGNLIIFDSTSSSGLEVTVCDRADGVYCENASCTALVDLGGACSGSLACAGDDTYCSTTCKAKVAAGASCSDSSQACQKGAYCDFDTQVCLATLANGAACTSNQQCESAYCESPGTCSASGSVGNLGLSFFCY